MKAKGFLLDVEDLTATNRYDFKVITRQRRICALDVKGGEGNSVTLSYRPPECHEFGIWSHLAGSFQLQPADQARALIGRIVKVMVNREEQTKHVDFFIVWDAICGSSMRRCPYREKALKTVLPCLYLFPQRMPTKNEPHPPLHTLKTTKLPALLLKHQGLPQSYWKGHLSLSPSFLDPFQFFHSRPFICKDGANMPILPGSPSLPIPFNII